MTQASSIAEYLHNSGALNDKIDIFFIFVLHFKIVGKKAHYELYNSGKAVETWVKTIKTWKI